MCRSPRRWSSAPLGAALERLELIAVEHRHRIRHRLQIVEERDPRQREPRRKLGRIDAPLDVGHLRGLVDDRPGDAEGSGGDGGAFRRVGEESIDDLQQPGKLGGRERLHIDGNRPAISRLEQSDERFGAANIPCEDHVHDCKLTSRAFCSTFHTNYSAKASKVAKASKRDTKDTKGTKELSERIL
jgi:hypothetical protein